MLLGCGASGAAVRVLRHHSIDCHHQNALAVASALDCDVCESSKGVSIFLVGAAVDGALVQEASATRETRLVLL